METRRRLVEAAIELFAQSGVAATSLNAVAEHAGFSRGAVHGNYSSKDELAAAVAESVVGELGPQLRECLQAEAPSGTRLAAYLRAFLEYCSAHPDATRALIAVVEYFGRQQPQYYGDRAAASVADLVALFEEGQRAGEMRAFDAPTMAFAVRTVLDNTAMRLSATPNDAGEVTAEIVALFTAATRSEGAPA
ncbi:MULTISPECIES: TetR/AcrR family transcriptional regulator [Glycomyces]|uniref:AcrR family transcriptional regulator n=2 Tax=Glycomyces TaxID=58113 RepID=A0A9X3PI06_9ACTN|nr:TetR/AcrR family transcriptional regulator [Glycomyces lechevalierae]MDA1384048.1 TetR/AcrR family transcriptional regulator [Glycomyces lechevalierae]MDR7340957.1 AcrR family transcriptional regulator [Glycomyces lechevalierae]